MYSWVSAVAQDSLEVKQTLVEGQVPNREKIPSRLTLKCQLLYRSLKVDKQKHFQSQRTFPSPRAIREDPAICAGLICEHITRYHQHMQSECVALSPNCALKK